MKKYICWMLCLFLLFSMTACEATPPDTVTGWVVTCGRSPYFFEVDGGNGKNYAFIVTGDTELVWEDTSAWDIWREDADPWDVFSCGMYVTVAVGEEAESSDASVDECVKGWYHADAVTVTDVDEWYFAVDEKPVIYLYPEETLDVQIRLDLDGRLTCTYPVYRDGWTVTAQPDGTLTDASGQTYNYLYWEGAAAAQYDFSAGFCVKGSDTAAFLENALEKLGLNRREANEFIVYWLPRMENNAYNLISFQQESYTDTARLDISPTPDTLIRVFMAWRALDGEVEIAPQILESPQRTGFTVVEWGGVEIA